MERRTEKLEIVGTAVGEFNSKIMPLNAKRSKQQDEKNEQLRENYWKHG